MSTAPSSTTLPADVHPSPHADRVPGWMQAVGLMLAPAAWFLQLTVDTWAATHACFPRDEPLLAAVAPLAAPVGIADAVALLLGLLALAVAWGGWRRSRGERAGGSAKSMSSGDGRTRFLCMAGMLSTAMVLMAMAYAALAHMALPGCGT